MNEVKLSLDDEEKHLFADMKRQFGWVGIVALMLLKLGKGNKVLIARKWNTLVKESGLSNLGLEETTEANIANSLRDLSKICKESVEVLPNMSRARSLFYKVSDPKGVLRDLTDFKTSGPLQEIDKINQLRSQLIEKYCAKMFMKGVNPCTLLSSIEGLSERINATLKDLRKGEHVDFLLVTLETFRDEGYSILKGKVKQGVSCRVIASDADQKLIEELRANSIETKILREYLDGAPTKFHPLRFVVTDRKAHIFQRSPKGLDWALEFDKDKAEVIITLLNWVFKELWNKLPQSEVKRSEV